MSVNRYLTPNTPPAEFVCRRIRIPKDEEWMALFTGALFPLTEAENWEQYGAMSPEDTAYFMLERLWEFLDDGTFCMLGAIMPYATTNPPPNTLQCDGTVYNRVDYPTLYNALATEFIVDADTFRVPDLRGRSVIGVGQGTGLTERFMNDEGGEEVHVLTVEELAQHNHSTVPHSHIDAGHFHLSNYPIFNLDLEGAGVPDVFGAGNPPIQTPTTTSSANIQNSDVTVNDTGESEPHNNMPPFTALRYCIVAR